MIATLGAGACGNTTTEKDVPGVLLAPLRGAIFTTLADGTRVNANIYAAKTDVYLDGGPGPGAPAMAACLPEGFYYFQVTDPSGMTLLSTDEIGCRRFEVTADCTIEYAPESCAMAHVVGVDVDHGGDTIQLMPYDDTPNMGDEYKVWATPVEAWAEAGGAFVNSSSKTDNFKVRGPAPFCGDGNLDEGEQCDDGNNVGGDGCSAVCTIEPPCGDGNLDEGEECDDGNTVDGDGCSAICTIEPFCGDGNLDDGEECDDGNNVGGDGCSADCAIEHGPKCGNGIVEEGEQCDDGNDNNEDTCTNDCKICDVIKTL